MRYWIMPNQKKGDRIRAITMQSVPHVEKGNLRIAFLRAVASSAGGKVELTK